MLQGVTLGLALLSHLQAACLLAGPLFLHLSRCWHNRGSRTWYVVGFIVVVIGGLVGVSWLISTRLEVEAIFLPLFQGRPGSVNYAVLSFKHIGDMLNQSLLMYPCMAFLVTTLLAGRRRFSLDQTDMLLIFMSAGSLLFLLVVDPVLGMARDWDLMSLPLLPPMLFLIYRMDKSEIQLSARTIAACTLVCVLATSSFVTVSVYEPPTVLRFYTLLKHYGAENRGGWANYVGYLETHGPTDRFQTALQEMDQLYPDYQRLRQVYALLDRRDYPRALDIAAELVAASPFQADFLQVLGNAHGKLGHDDSAELYYEQAVKLKPHHVIQNELGQLYLKRGKYDEALETFKRARGHAPHESFVGEGLGLTYIYLKHYASALAVADSLFMDNPNSPGGHLLKLTVAINTGDNETARYYYHEFLAHGQGRSDYERMREYYHYLR